MTLLTILAILLIVLGVAMILKLTPEQVTDDLMRLVSPEQTLRDKARIAQGKKKTRKLSEELRNIQRALTETGNGAKFALICASSLIFLVAGVILAIAIDNLFLAPVFAVACSLIPFLYAKGIANSYVKHIDLELETTLSMISTSYVRTEDIVKAVEENLLYIRPPLSEIFRSFVGETRLISSDTKAAILHLRSRIQNDIFKEWCDALIQCQDDRTLKDTLYPIVSKLTDVRLVNNELSTLLQSVRVEYYSMVALVLINIPLLYFLNKDWYNTLMHTIAGKIVLAICGLVILITAGLMLKFTKPIKYYG